MGLRLRKFARKLGVSALATTLCLLVLEIGLRLAGYEPLYDTYSKPDLFWRYDPVLGWAHDHDQSGTFVGPRPFPVEFRGHVHINSRGLRGAELTDPPPGGFRVLFLGDSLTAGFEVDDDKTFAALAQDELTAELGVPVQTINAGVRGYGTDQSYLYYRDTGRALHPDLVVFQAAINDFEDNTTLHRARRAFGKAAFKLQPDGTLELVNTPVPQYPFCSGVRMDAAFQPVEIDTSRSRAMCWLQANLADHSALFTFVTLRIRQTPHLVEKLSSLGTPNDQSVDMSTRGATSTQTPASRLTTALLRQLNKAVTADGARFLIAIRGPEWKLLDVAALEGDGVRTFDLADVEARGSIDAGDGTRFDQSLHYVADSHYNEAGHARVAELMTPVIARELRAVSAERAQARQDRSP
jgi:hypothetical protein